MDVFPKFIIEDGNLIIAKATYHRQIAHDINLVTGGGWWRRKDNIFTLYGDSDQFGKATLEAIAECIKEKKVYTNYTCSHSIADEHLFFYDTGSELIPLNKTE